MENIQKHIDVWNNCLRIIEQNIDSRKFDTWFSPIKPVSFNEDSSTLTVEVPSDFFREYIEGAFLDVIKFALKKVIGTDAKLFYMVHPVKKEDAITFPASESNVPENKAISIAAINPTVNPGAIVYPGLKKITIDPRLNPAYCFDNLIQGECNRMGVVAGESISNAPGKTSFNPLFLFGGPGLGKTHIAQAIGLSIHEKNPDLIVLYVTGNEFKNQYVQAVNVRNQLTDFMAFYQRIDVLIVDDIQDLVGQGSQAAFFNIFNHLHQMGKQLIFTSDRAPVDLRNFEERLLSRFKWGLSVELCRPDFSTRLAMLKSRSLREGIDIDDEILEYLASRVKSNFRELEGILISLIAHATLAHRDISMELAAEVTDKIVSDNVSDITIEKVQDTVCDYFKLSKEELLSLSRKRQIVQARQIAMYMCRNLITNCSLSTIGAEIGGKDHATVLHACSTVSDLMSTDRNFKQYVMDIEKILVSARV